MNSLIRDIKRCANRKENRVVATYIKKVGLEADKGIPDVGSMKFRVVKRQYRKSKEIQIRPFGSKKGIKEDAEIILGSVIGI